MKKRIQFLFLIILFIFIFSHSQTIFPPYDLSETQAIQIISEKKAEQKLEFAFDLHKVLVHKKRDLMWNLVRNYPRKREFLRILWNLPLMIMLGSIAWQYILNALPWDRHKYKEVTSERFVDGLRQAHAIELVDFFTTILNAQVPDPFMQEILVELKAKGYPLYIASNIGKQIFIKFKEQLKLSNQNFLDLFNKNDEGLEGKTIDYGTSKSEKPSPEYYKEYLDQYDPHRTKLIIFVDDKLINIPPATAQGFLGIHFINAQQLRNDLVKLGVL